MRTPIHALLLLIICAAFSGALHAQTVRWQQIGGPEGVGVTDMIRDPDGRIYAATMTGTIYRSTDGGYRWRGLPIHDDSYIASLIRTRSGSLLALGFSGRLHRSTDLGESWAVVDDTFRTEGNSNSPLALDSAGGVIAGTGDAIIRSTDDGTTWTRLTGTDLDVPWAIVVGKDGRIVVCLYKSQTFGMATFLVSSDGGANWTRSVDSDSVFMATFNAMMVTPSGAIVGGSYHSIARSTDGGLTWTVPTLDEMTRDIDAFATLPSGALIVNSYNGLLRSTDDGVTWTSVTPQAAPSTIASLLPLPDGRVIAGTLDDGAYRSLDDRLLLWEESNSGLGRREVRSLQVEPSGALLVNTGLRIFRSTDAGSTWKMILNRGSLMLNALTVAPDGTIHVGVPFEPTGNIWTSTDGGARWVPTAVGEGEYVRALVPDREGRVYAAIDVEPLQRSSVDGFSWEQWGSQVPIGPFASLAFDEAGDLIAGSDHGGIFRIPVATGEPQSLIATPHGRINDIKIGTAGRIYAATDKAGVLVSTDNGASWNRSMVGLRDTMVLDLTVDRTGAVYAATMLGGVYRSTDDGTTWAAVNDDLEEPWFYSLARDSSGAILAGGRLTGIYRTDGVSGVDDRSLPAYADGPTAGLTVAPNPASGSALIRWRQANPGHARLTVTDAIGRDVAVLVDETLPAGEQTATLDVSALPSGVYLCRLSVGGASVTGRVVVR